jgi:1-acyl-sn-glycerol-3-phosphate acyltransferase
MKAVLYVAFKGLIRVGFRCYYKEIRLQDMDRVPRVGPVMLLPNHQNALMDPLLYAAFARGKPYFLTRSDVFGNTLLKWVFEGLRMMPVYRLRDGRETLDRNQEVFDRCAALFAQGEQLLLFPEASHCLRRQVRPLSKGFTRILARSFETYPGIDIAIVPVGMNYEAGSHFPDRVALCFGNPFSARAYWSENRGQLDFSPLRERTFRAITTLTTHIPPELDYTLWEASLEKAEVDFLNPSVVNALISRGEIPGAPPTHPSTLFARAWDALFRVLNGPVWLPWRWISKNRVPEPEFTSTFRFLYCLIAFPLFYLLCGALFSLFMPWELAVGLVLLLFLHNLAYVKLR